jgi:glycosyltransferase involved in cell wall biosynthesis
LNQPRVLIVGAFPPPEAGIVGGVASSCRVMLASSLPRRLDLLLVDSSQISNPPPGFVVRLLLALRRGLQFLWRFERGRPESVWLFSSPGASSLEKGLLAWYARIRGRRTVLLPRGIAPTQLGDGLGARLLMAVCFGGAHRIVCQGRAWQDFALKRLRRNPSEVPIIRNWTATEEYLSIGRARAAKSGAVRMVYLGWVEEDKGAIDLLTACAQLPPGLAWELDIVGDGRAMPRVLEWIDRNGKAAQVRATGWLQGEPKLSVLRAADVFVLPSWAEGLPNAMIEAMACRLACVLTDVGNIRDAVGDAVVLVPARDTAALARELEIVIRDDARRAALAERAFATAQSEFGTERAMDKLVQLTKET